MRNDNDALDGADTSSPKKSNYDVGYKKPPKATQFKKGKSGNPGGRTKGAKNRQIAAGDDELRAIILREARRTISVREGGKIVTCQMTEAIMRSASFEAVKGKANAQKLFFALVTIAQKAERLEGREFFAAAIDYKQRAERELESRRLTGSSGPEIIPHPDDVITDFATGRVNFKGPIDKNEQERLKFLLEREEEYEAWRTDPEGYWARAAAGLPWPRLFDRALDRSAFPSPQWFPGGEINVCYAALDRHVDDGRGNETALIYESPITGASGCYSFADLQARTARPGAFRSLFSELYLSVYSRSFAGRCEANSSRSLED